MHSESTQSPEQHRAHARLMADAARVSTLGSRGHAHNTAPTRFLDAKGIAQPTLVVNGSNDIVVPTVNSYILQQHLPNAELILFPDSNHGSHFQFTEQFNRWLTDFVDSGAEAPILVG